MNKVIKLYADWCQPCKRLTAYLDSIGVKTENYNIDEIEGMKLAQDLGTLTVPVLKIGNNLCTSSDKLEVDKFLKENGVLK